MNRSEWFLIGFFKKSLSVEGQTSTFRWSTVDRYGYEDEINGQISPFLSGLSYEFDSLSDAIRASNSEGNHLLAVAVKQKDEFIDEIEWERDYMVGEKDRGWWRKTYFGEHLLIAPLDEWTFLGYDVCTTWLKREPVPLSLRQKFEMENGEELFSRYDDALVFKTHLESPDEEGQYVLSILDTGIHG